jgi:hypothetical protein
VGCGAAKWAWRSKVGCGAAKWGMAQLSGMWRSQVGCGITRLGCGRSEEFSAMAATGYLGPGLQSILGPASWANFFRMLVHF